MRFLPLMILLGFPAAELFIMVRVADEIGWWLAAWLIMMAIVVAVLIREAGVSLPSKLANALRNGNSLSSSLMDSSRTLIAGLLLILPGLLSDLMAVGLLLMPFHIPRTAPVSEGVIEGEYRRVDRNRKSLH